MASRLQLLHAGPALCSYEVLSSMLLVLVGTQVRERGMRREALVLPQELVVWLGQLCVACGVL